MFIPQRALAHGKVSIWIYLLQISFQRIPPTEMSQWSQKHSCQRRKKETKNSLVRNSQTTNVKLGWRFSLNKCLVSIYILSCLVRLTVTYKHAELHLRFLISMQKVLQDHTCCREKRILVQGSANLDSSPTSARS